MTKFSGNFPSVSSSSAVTKISSVRTLRARKSSFSGLMRMPMNGGSVSSSKPRATSVCAGSGVAVFLRVGAIAVAIFEIEPEIFHRFAPQFFDDPIVNLVAAKFRRRPFRARAASVAASGAYSSSERSATSPSLCGGVGFEKMRAAVNGVHRLPAIRFARISAHERRVCLAQDSVNYRDLIRFQATLLSQQSPVKHIR